MIVIGNIFGKVYFLVEYFTETELLYSESIYLQGDKCAFFVVIVLEWIFCIESKNLVSLMAGMKYF